MSTSNTSNLTLDNLPWENRDLISDTSSDTDRLINEADNVLSSSDDTASIMSTDTMELLTRSDELSRAATPTMLLASNGLFSQINTNAIKAGQVIEALEKTIGSFIN